MIFCSSVGGVVAINPASTAGFLVFQELADDREAWKYQVSVSSSKDDLTGCSHSWAYHGKTLR
ncbi:hypothetical protein O9992_25555 [Vibrio lentus]|nr:hypothetical protein [Vibrio lentus]